MAVVLTVVAVSTGEGFEMNRIFTHTIGCLACVAMASVADAQMVRVGPFGGVSIRAPFVSIDTLPFGGGRASEHHSRRSTRELSPTVTVTVIDPTDTIITNLTAASSITPQPSLPPCRSILCLFTRRRSIPMSSIRLPITSIRKPVITKSLDRRVRRTLRPRLPERLRASALQLKRSLSLRRDDSEVWINYLAPDRIVQTIDSGTAPGSLSDLLLNYEGVIGNPSLSSICAASGFNETHGLLRAFVGTKATELPQKVGAPNEADAVPAPAPAAKSGEPTLAQPVRPADGADQGGKNTKEELPLPDPTPL